MTWDDDIALECNPIPGHKEGGQCYHLGCKNVATHRQRYGATWYCYWCAVQINGKAKKKIIISAKEVLWEALQTTQGITE